MDQMAALAHIRTVIKAAKSSEDVETLKQILREVLSLVEKALGRKG